MRLFSRLYDRVLGWAGHRHATWYLAGLSFAESSFFPVPPDVMLAPMALARLDRAWYFALVATVASAAGGLAGYLIGMFAIDAVLPWLQQLGYYPAYLQARDWFREWGVWVVFVAGFSPIPYKVFTISAGAASMAFLPFLLASLIGRGARFFLVAAALRMGGVRMEAFLRRYIDVLGWLMVAFVIVAYLLYRGS